VPECVVRLCVILPNEDVVEVETFRRTINDKLLFIIDCEVCLIRYCMDTVTIYNGSGLNMHGHTQTTKFWKCIELHTETKTERWYRFDRGHPVV